MVFHAWIPKVFSYSSRKESSIEFKTDDVLRWLAQINKLVGEKDTAKPHFLRLAPSLPRRVVIRLVPPTPTQITHHVARA